MIDNTPYFGKRDIFYYILISDKQTMRDSIISELFGEESKKNYYNPISYKKSTNHIFLAKFWKDIYAVNKVVNSYLSYNKKLNTQYIIKELYREDFIKLIPDIDEKFILENNIEKHELVTYNKNLKSRKIEESYLIEWNEFRKKYKASSCYKRVKSPHHWLKCKNCGLIPLVNEYDNCRSTACGCGEDDYNHLSIRAESIMSFYKRHNSVNCFNTDELRMNWNQWVDTGQDIFRDMKKIYPDIW